MAGRRRPAPPAGVRARRRDAVAADHRRGGDRPARPAARRPGPGPAGGAAGAVRPRPPQEGPQLLEGQPAEGGAGGGTGLRRRAAGPRRAHVGPRSADGGRLPGLHPGDARRGPHGPAVQPHPRRGRGPLRSGQHHPARPDGAVRLAVRAAAPDPHVGHGRDRAPGDRPPRAARRARRRPAGRPRAVRRRQRPPRRRHAAPDRVRHPLAEQRSADAGGAVPPALRRGTGGGGRRRPPGRLPGRCDERRPPGGRGHRSSCSGSRCAGTASACRSGSRPAPP